MKNVEITCSMPNREECLHIQQPRSQMVKVVESCFNSTLFSLHKVIQDIKRGSGGWMIETSVGALVQVEENDHHSSIQETKIVMLPCGWPSWWSGWSHDQSPMVMSLNPYQCLTGWASRTRLAWCVLCLLCGFRANAPKRADCPEHAPTGSSWDILLIIPKRKGNKSHGSKWKGWKEVCRGE